MIVGYARTSTLDQTAGLEAQLRDLKTEGCERVFEEQVSSVDVKARESLEELEERIKLISAYVEAANEIAVRPRWFNSVFTNCSRSAILIARHVGIRIPVDYRVVINGYFPDYLYEQGLTNTEIDIQQLYSLGDITANALANGLDEGYSAAIRKDVPVP